MTALGCPPEIGFHRVKHGIKVDIEDNGLTVTKINPTSNYSHGVAISDRPLFGHAFFEVQLKGHGSSWSGSFKIGVMKVPIGSDFTIPRYSPQNDYTFVWSSNQLFKGQDSSPWEGGNLENVAVGSRIGFHLRPNGTLNFYQGETSLPVAFSNLYSPDHDLYALVDVYGQAKQLTIVRSYCLEVNLMVLCCMAVRRSLPKPTSREHLDSLPLPRSMKNLLARYS